MAKELAEFYFGFKGRATRRDFNVKFALVALAGSIVAGILDVMFADGDIFAAANSSPFSNAWNVLVAVSMLAVMCRRLHDMNLSGWWQVPAHLIGYGGMKLILVMAGVTIFGLMLDPFTVGITGFFLLNAVLIFYLVFFLMLSGKRGTDGPNRFGPDPLLEVTHV